MRQAEAEVLTLLLKADNNSGFRGVGFRGSSEAKPYKAQVQRGGKIMYLGLFVTAEEAALCYARTPEAQAALAGDAKWEAKLCSVSVARAGGECSMFVVVPAQEL